MNFLYYIVFIALIFIQQSCKPDDQVQPSKPNTNSNKKEYNVIEIEFTAIPKYIPEEIVEKRPSLEYENQSSIKQKIVINPDKIFEKSIFNRNPDQLYNIVDTDKFFTIPINIYNDQILPGTSRWKYTERETKLLSLTNFKDSIYIEPHSKTLIDLSITYEMIRISYVAKLKEKSSDSTVNITGIWTGIYPSKKTISYKTQTF